MRPDFPGFLGKDEKLQRNKRESATANIHPDIENVEVAKVSNSSSAPKKDSPPPILSLNEVSSSKQDQPSHSTPEPQRSPSPIHNPSSPSSQYSPSDAGQSPSHSFSFPDVDSQYHKKSHMFAEPSSQSMKDYSSESCISNSKYMPSYPWHHPPTSGSTLPEGMPNSSLVPLLLPYPSLSHSVIYMSQYMNPFMPSCTGSTLAEKKKRNRTFIDPVSEVIRFCKRDHG